MRVNKNITIIIIAALCSLAFFNPSFIDIEIESKFCYYLLMVLLIFPFFISKKLNIERIIQFLYGMLFLCILLSIFMANTIHGQSLGISFMTVFPYFSYFLFFGFVSRNINLEEIEKTVKILAIIQIVIFLISYFSYPDTLFGSAFEDLDRGIKIRVSTDIFYVVCLLFLTVQRLVNDKSLTNFLYIFICLTIIIMSGSRQWIFYCLFLSFFIYLNRISWKNKIGFLLIGVMFVLTLSKLTFFKNLIEFSQNQLEENSQKQDVRVLDYVYYFYEGQTGVSSHLLGNGVYSTGHSDYGKKMDFLSEFSHLHPHDAGWAGFYFFFGAFSTFFLLVIILYFISSGTLDSAIYLKSFVAFIALTSFFGGGILYPFQIFAFTLAIYGIWKASKLNREKC